MAEDFFSKNSENKIKLIINGREIPFESGVSGYSYYDAKTFFKEPERSAAGVINKLNSYATFLTPRVKFSFKYMPIGAYRIIKKLLKEYNEFIVTAYDICEDTYVTHKMYFYPDDYPDILGKDFKVLGLLNAEFELVGTNASLDTYSLVYNSNTEASLTSGLEFYYGQEVTIGQYDQIDEATTDPTTFTKDGYRLSGWNTKADGSGYSYLTGETVKLTNSTVLYAQWQPETNFVLSFDYQDATTEILVTSKEVISGTTVGELPIPGRTGFSFGGWYTSQNGKGTKISETSTFTQDRNITVYAYWVGNDIIISFDANGGFGTPSVSGKMSSVTKKCGETFKLPASIYTKTSSGISFKGWATTADATEVEYEDEQEITVPISNLKLYALYGKPYTLTYRTNGGSYDKFTEFCVRLNSPMRTTRSNYRLVGWYSDSSLTTPVGFPLVLTANMDIYAKWEWIGV